MGRGQRPPCSQEGQDPSPLILKEAAAARKARGGQFLPHICVHPTPPFNFTFTFKSNVSFYLPRTQNGLKSFPLQGLFQMPFKTSSSSAARGTTGPILPVQGRQGQPLQFHRFRLQCVVYFLHSLVALNNVFLIHGRSFLSNHSGTPFAPLLSRPSQKTPIFLFRVIFL